MLNAQWLETFTALSETGSMTRTAAALNMTQPGVSQHVKKLEAQLGTPLLRRDGRSFTLTPAGERVRALGLARRAEEARLRAGIGVVPQDTVLFNDSIAYNIAYGAPTTATRADIENVALLAHLDDFIARLPEGYDTVVGERGLKLSGGEKQRIAIARAMLKNPAVLIFDEATSSLDTQAEQAINQALSELAADHTTLVIAHRLSTVVDADRIAVMDAGRVIETGTHAELLARDGLYARMWRLQGTADTSRVST